MMYLLVWPIVQAQAQGIDVSAKIMMSSQKLSRDEKHKGAPSTANVVVWLSSDSAKVTTPSHQTAYRLVQKDKQFIPHLLVVPTGSTVEFPNEDPFFHNVFSLFNGKRFDLGLYESGTSRSVRFGREGVSYIFCNIHPEMGAIILALSTPYYGTSAANGSVVIHNVLPGTYQLNVWSEIGQPIESTGIHKVVQVSNEAVHLGDIVLQPRDSSLENHKNKFGEDYQPAPDHRY
jgi:plastocyanin